MRIVATATVLRPGGLPKTARAGACLLACLAALLLVPHSLSSCGRKEPVVVGYLGGLSGKSSDVGSYGRDGAILAVEARNAAGGIRGRKVLLDARDDEQLPARAAAGVNALADRGALAVVGPITSAMAESAVPVANRRGLVLVSPTVTTDELLGKDDCFIRVIGAIRDISGRMAEHLHDRQGVRLVATVSDTDNRAYTENWNARFMERLESRGGRIVASEQFSSSGDVRFAPIARRLAGSGADAILISTNASDAAMICQQLRKIGWKKPVAVASWASSGEFPSLGGASVEGVFVTQLFNRESRDPRYISFVERYRKRFGTDPGFASVLSYEAAETVMDALEANGVKGGDALKAQILRAGKRRGLQESYAIDAFGDATRDSHIAVVRDRAYRILP
jgi:branched-chain amino acid transport system substrate-binding protein